MFGASSSFGAKRTDSYQKNKSAQTGSVKEAGETGVEAVGHENFLKGFACFEKGAYKKACPFFYTYIRDNSADVKDYEWAEFFLGIGLAKLGYSHASVDILSHLVTRKPNQKIVTYSLEVFETIIRTLPFDTDVVINKTICDQDYGFIEGYLSDFINYHQGVYDWKHGFFDWGNEHFNRIDKDSYYYFKYRFQFAKFLLYKDQITDSILVLEEILDSNVKSSDLLDDARKMFARLLYETGNFKEADLYYRQIEKTLLEQSQNLLERAWVHYRLGHPEKAMGLLYAFEAPSYKSSFTPEYYILKSFIYKDVCHYQKALDVVSDFNERYGISLKTIYSRGEPSENYPLMLVLLGKDQIKETWQFLDLLLEEKKNLKRIKDSAFNHYMNTLYDIQIQESKDALRSKINDAYEKMANELLKYEEEAHLMAYEIGIDMYQRVYQSHYKKASSGESLPEKGTAVYSFQGEFWNDELADYTVHLPDKCNKMEEWDIFFK